MTSLKLGMVGLDTSHVTAFTELLNNEANPNHVRGGKMVSAFPGGTKNFQHSHSRVGGFTNDLRDKYGLAIHDSIERVADECDAVFLESVDGRQHLEQFQKIAPFGKPVFIDKPFATTTAEGKQILELSAKYKAPVYSSSAIRYAKGIRDLAAGEKVQSALAYGPMALLEDYPGYFWYGIHSAEVLFSKMGRGCVSVQVKASDAMDFISGTWADGRVGAIHGFRIEGVWEFGAVLYTAKGVHKGVAMSDPPYYACMLPHVIEFFNSGKPEVDPGESLEIAAFLEAAFESRTTGKEVALAQTK